MTEDEAKTKWCPFARYTSIRGTGINRWVDQGETQLNPGPASCIGSACMAWRPGRTMFENTATGALTDRDLTGNGKWISVGGFCGLAGHP